MERQARRNAGWSCPVRATMMRSYTRGPLPLFVSTTTARPFAGSATAKLRKPLFAPQCQSVRPYSSSCRPQPRPQALDRLSPLPGDGLGAPADRRVDLRRSSAFVVADRHRPIELVAPGPAALGHPERLQHVLSQHPGDRPVRHPLDHPLQIEESFARVAIRFARLAGGRERPRLVAPVRQPARMSLLTPCDTSTICYGGGKSRPCERNARATRAFMPADARVPHPVDLPRAPGSCGGALRSACGPMLEGSASPDNACATCSSRARRSPRP